MSRAAILLCSLLLVATTNVARAEWLPLGNPVATLIAEQTGPQLCSDGRGGAFVIWYQSAMARAGRIDAAGDRMTGWPDEGIPVPPMSGGTHWRVDLLAAVPDRTGGVYLLLLAGPPCGIHCTNIPGRLVVQRLSSSGAIERGWSPEGLPVDAHELPLSEARGARMIEDGSGGVLVAFTAVRATASGDLRTVLTQTVTPDARLRWGANAVVLADGVDVEGPTAVASDGGGGAIVAWRSWGPDQQVHVLAQRLSANGRVSWTRGGITISRAMPTIVGPVAVGDRQEGVHLAWASPAESGSEVQAALVATGPRPPVPMGRVIARRRDPVEALRLVPGSPHGAILGWFEHGEPEHRGFAMRLIRDRAGDVRSFGISRMGIDHPQFVMTADGDGGAFLAWNDRGEEAPVFAQHLGREGRVMTGWRREGEPITRWPDGADRIQSLAVDLNIASPSRGEAMVAWCSNRWTDPAPHHISAEQSYVTLLRREGPAAVPPPVITSAPGRLADSHPAPVPPAPRFALGAISPSPATARSLVRFTLPDDSPARLALFDVAGRRIASRDVSLGAGEHVVPLRDGARVAPGVYLLRLQQCGRTATRAVTVLD